MIPHEALEVLELQKILKLITGFSHSDATRDWVRNITPFSDKTEIETRFNQIRELLRMSSEQDPLMISDFPDIAEHLARLRPEGSVLDGQELSAFIPVLTVLSDVSLHMGRRADIPFLNALAHSVTGFPDILKTLVRSVDSEGNILDSASSALAEIRGSIRRLESRISKRLEEMMRDERIAVFLQDDFITQRSGRWVIPVRMDSKGQITGVVHDVSKSGETAFIEPIGIIHLSNELENLIAEQKAEEIRILRTISARLRAVVEDLQEQYRILIHLDGLSSIRLFAEQLGMQIPRINESGQINLIQARHPLLMLALQKTEGPAVVPLDVTLGGEQNVMVITGANAGGKTVAVKTIGILQVMAQSGMPVPADSSSGFPVVKDLLLDIGDEQSIEASLSTFAAHVTRIAEILKKADPQALILIDELGTGTDPEEGAALACAVLMEIRTTKALVFATTHLTDIKGFVHRSAGMVNASMDFDLKSLSPLYRLRIGEPGRSHALDIAKRYGLPERIITAARDLMGGMKGEFEKLIADLHESRNHYENSLAEVSRLQADADKKMRLIESAQKETELQKKQTLAHAYEEADRIITDIRRQMYAFLEEIKLKGRKASQEVLKKAAQTQESVIQKLREYSEDYDMLSIEDIVEGSEVFVRSLGSDARVIDVSLRNDRVRVMAGGKEIEVPVTDLGKKRGQRTEETVSAALNQERDELTYSQINIVGLRVDEALSVLEPFLNDASLQGIREVRVIHGVGKGILLRAVHEHLKGHPLIKGFKHAGQSEGGIGVTVATMVQ